MIERWRRRLHRAEDTLLAAMLLALLLLSVLQIALRLFFETGLTWAEPLSRMGVLWVALLGALGATRQRQHILIDVFQRIAGPRVRRVLWALTQLAAAFVAGALAWFGAGLVGLEREAPVPFVLGIPSWVPMLVLPLGFGLMSVRFVVAALAGPPPPGEGRDGGRP
jgi:TRAP-type C4-dicarboxylate transport system permease small subunit